MSKKSKMTSGLLKRIIIRELAALTAEDQITAIEELANLTHSLVSDAIQVLQTDPERKCVS